MSMNLDDIFGSDAESTNISSFFTDDDKNVGAPESKSEGEDTWVNQLAFESASQFDEASFLESVDDDDNSGDPKDAPKDDDVDASGDDDEDDKKGKKSSKKDDDDDDASDDDDNDKKDKKSSKKDDDKDDDDDDASKGDECGMSCKCCKSIEADTGIDVFNDISSMENAEDIELMLSLSADDDEDEKSAPVADPSDKGDDDDDDKKSSKKDDDDDDDDDDDKGDDDDDKSAQDTVIGFNSDFDTMSLFGDLEDL